MDKFLERVADFLVGMFRPSHVVVVLAVVSALFAFSPFGWVEHQGIEKEVQSFKFYIWLVFLVSTLLILISGLQFFWAVIENIAKKLTRHRRVRSIDLPNGSKFILIFMEGQRPESVSLHTRHPDVIALRKAELIQLTNVLSASDYQYFRLSDLGQSVASRDEDVSIEGRAAGDLLEYLKQVTGEDIQPNLFKSL